ncbi:hypothetical protein CT19425_U470009 [Cupriavidus taiwanensis]|uniref:Uncharacterized protein n=1 Tax=Cupriavidus taiwanensis TaxID=164546 RepID=A0A375I865_9BURK|nr:hypothetical protein CT19425_U470009 [Cupriavidus taiwanensis]
MGAPNWRTPMNILIAAHKKYYQIFSNFHQGFSDMALARKPTT